MERLIHYLRGIRIGVALGGGAARGMAHLGVLNALDQHGIVVDMIAGTSVGAMTGVMYSAGLDCAYLTSRFAADLTPSWTSATFPAGLLVPPVQLPQRPVRNDAAKHLHDWKFEQLAVPCSAVTVDLVSGLAVVRDHGDAVHAILESINFRAFVPHLPQRTGAGRWRRNE